MSSRIIMIVNLPFQLIHIKPNLRFIQYLQNIIQIYLFLFLEIYCHDGQGFLYFGGVFWLEYFNKLIKIYRSIATHTPLTTLNLKILLKFFPLLLRRFKFYHFKNGHQIVKGQHFYFVQIFHLLSIQFMMNNIISWQSRILLKYLLVIFYLKTSHSRLLLNRSTSGCLKRRRCVVCLHF